MKTHRLLILLSALSCFAACTKSPVHSPSIPEDPAIEKQIDRLMSKMSLDDKVGQMLQINLDVLGGYAMKDGRMQWVLDEKKVDTLIANYRVGSFLNVPGRAASPEDWRNWIGMFQKYSMEHLGIPTIYGLDHNHGASYSQGATIFPQPINVGASFNVELVKQMAEVTAYESRAGDYLGVQSRRGPRPRPALAAHLREFR